MSWKQQFKNGVVAAADSSIEFKTPGILQTLSPPEWLVTTKQTGQLQISLEVQSKNKRQSGPARIFTLSQDTSNRNLTIGQKYAELIIRLRSPATNRNGWPDYVIPAVFSTTDWHNIELTLTPARLHVRVDGVDSLTVNLPDNSLATWSEKHKLALGNELTGNRPWLGTIRKAMVVADGQRIDYLAPNTLHMPPVITIPERYKEKPKYQLQPFFTDRYASPDLRDLILNFFWFIPLGFIGVRTRLPLRSIVLVTAICASISFAIEFGQLFLPTRITSIDDLIMNTLGGFAGAWLSKRRRYKYISS